MKKILVTGASGPQGRAVVEKLLQAGLSVRALVRDPAKAQDLTALGAQVVQGDLDDQDSLAAATQGQDGVFMTIAFFTGTHAQARNLILAASRQGVTQLVWNVAGRVLDRDVGNPAIDKWRPILADLRDSGLSFTVLQPTIYMENFLIPAVAREIAEKNVLAYPVPVDGHTQWISHQDAAACTVAAFQADRAGERIIDICGPEDLTGPQVAERIGRALGRPITFRTMPTAEFAQAAAAGGAEELIVSHYRHLCDAPEAMSSNVDHAASLADLPITPTSIEDWAGLYADALGGRADRGV